VHGYQWAHCCDDLTIIECAANHFTLLMPHELVAGDLDTTVVPTMTDWLQRLGDVHAEPVAPEMSTSSGLDDEQEQVPTEPQPAADGADGLPHTPPLHSAPAAAAEAVLPQQPVAFVLPRRPKCAESWACSVWACDDNLPIWLEEPGLAPDVVDDADAGAQGVVLPDLDLTAGRLALGLNDLAWTAPDAPTVVFILHDFLDGNGERWSSLVFSTQLPVFGLHTPPGLLSQFTDALVLGPAAPVSASAERIAMQYFEAVRACLPAEGANCIIAGFEQTAAMATELALQLRMRCNDARGAHHVISVLLRASGDDAREEDAPLSSPAYQALYARVVATSATSAPPWRAFGAALARAGSFDRQLDMLAALRPPGVARASWDAEVDHDVRDSVTLFQLAEARLPCPIVSGHVTLVQGITGVVQGDLDASPRLQRKGSFARVLRVGRDLARRSAASTGDGSSSEPALGAHAENDAGDGL
jgi:hypothetical protein